MTQPAGSKHRKKPVDYWNIGFNIFSHIGFCAWLCSSWIKKLLSFFSTQFDENKTVHCHNTRQMSDFHIRVVHTELAKMALKYKCTILWNKHPEGLREMQSEQSFKDLVLLKQHVTLKSLIFKMQQNYVNFIEYCCSQKVPICTWLGLPVYLLYYIAVRKPHSQYYYYCLLFAIVRTNFGSIFVTCMLLVFYIN